MIAAWLAGWLTLAIAQGASPAVGQTRPGPGPGRSQDRLTDLSSVVAGAREAWQAGDLFASQRWLAVSPDALEGEDDEVLHQYWYFRLAVAYELSRYSDVRAAARRIRALRETPEAQFQSRYTEAVALLEGWPHDSQSKEAAINLLRSALAFASDPTRPRDEVQARLLLGKLLEGADGRVELDRALELAEARGLEEDAFRISAAIVRVEARTDPVAGSKVFEQARQRIRGEGPWSLYGWQAELEIAWLSASRAEALSFTTDLLARVEEHRQRQAGSVSTQMAFFSIWVDAYRRAIGYVLETDQDSASLELAFAWSERMRARSLAEQVAVRTGSPEGPQAQEPTDVKLEQLRQDIGHLQWQALIEPCGSRAVASPLSPELIRLLLDEEALVWRRTQGGESTSLPAPYTAGLVEVQEALREDEALLVFLVGHETDHYGAFAGGSHLLLVTRHDVTPHRLHPRPDLADETSLLLGSIRARRSRDALLVPSLYGQLSAILGDVSDKVRRLIVLADGPLHSLPLSLVEVEGRPLLERFEVVLAPSATLWLRWRLEPGLVQEGALLVADPDLGQTSVPCAAAEKVRSSLRFARREARAFRRAFGSGGQVLTGEQASERRLKTDGLAGVGLVSFAAHSLIADRDPRLSGIVLVGEGAVDDGLLQSREIAGLDFEHKAILLSACQSAAGQVVQGEGLLSLARAFFAGGASAVVGTLWPVRDDEAAALFSEIYRRLARGSPLGEAVREAQLEGFRNGAPPEAWAGVVLLGDADWALSRYESRKPDRRGFVVVAVAGVLLVALAVRLRLSRAV